MAFPGDADLLLCRGFSNLTAYESFRRRRDTTGTFVRTRLELLLRPSPVTGIESIRGVASTGVDQRLRHFFYGGAPRVALRAGLRFEDLVLGVSIVGAASPPLADAHDYLTGTKSAAPTPLHHIGLEWLSARRGVPQEPPDLLLVLIDASDVVLARGCRSG